MTPCIWPRHFWGAGVSGADFLQKETNAQTPGGEDASYYEGPDFLQLLCFDMALSNLPQKKCRNPSPPSKSGPDIVGSVQRLRLSRNDISTSPILWQNTGGNSSSLDDNWFSFDWNHRKALSMDIFEMEPLTSLTNEGWREIS